MKFFRRKLRRGDPVSTRGFADGVQGMAYALENLEVVNGHVEWTAFGAPRIFFDGGSSGGGRGAANPQAFDLVQSESGGTTTATLHRLYYASNILSFYQAGTLADTLPESAAVYIGIEYTYATKAVDILVGTTWSDVAHTTAPAHPATAARRPLYVLAGAEDDAEVWRYTVAVDLRNMPDVAGWI